MKIEDDFLEQEDFDKIQNFMGGDYPSISWFFKYRYYAMNEIVLEDEDELDKFQFTHTFYANCAPQSPHMEQLNCFLNLLQPVSIWRIRANLLTRLPNIVENTFHSDMVGHVSEEKLKHWTTSIFYVNTNNGYTVFEDGTKVESVANRLVSFPANMKHTGTSCTDQQTRIIINFNYYKATL